MGKGQDKKKTSFDPKEKAPDAAASQPGQTVNPLTSSICFMLFFIYLFIIIIIIFFFKKKGMYHTFFIINESIFLLFSISSSYTLWDLLSMYVDLLLL